MKYFAIIYVIIFFCLKVYAQPRVGNTIQLSFIPYYNKNALKLSNNIDNQIIKDTLSITSLRFYISALEFYNNDLQPVWKEIKSYHLIDMSQPETMRILLNIPASLSFSHLKFNLGIDSITNATGAGGGELDVTKGMYWAWHSGYINLKLEGTHSLSNAHKHAFQFHLGGFRKDEYCLQEIKLPIDRSENIMVKTDIASFLNQVNMAAQNTVMTPGKETIALSKQAAAMFSILKP